MARASILSTSAPSFMDIRPNIIQPSAGDLEEARIRRSLDLAKLRELTLAPEFEQQRLNLAKQGQMAEQQYRTTALANEQQYKTGALAETSAHNVAEEKHWAELLGVDHAKLQEAARQHNTSLSELTDYHQGVLKNQLAGDFMAHVASLYTGDPSKVAATTGALTPILDKLGLHQITAGLSLAIKDQRATAAKRNAAELTSVATTHGVNSSVFNKLLEDAKRDPETWSDTQPLLPDHIQEKTKPKNPQSGYLLDLLSKKLP